MLRCILANKKIMGGPGYCSLTYHHPAGFGADDTSVRSGGAAKSHASGQQPIRQALHEHTCGHKLCDTMTSALQGTEAACKRYIHPALPCCTPLSMHFERIIHMLAVWSTSQSRLDADAHQLLISQQMQQRFALCSNQTVLIIYLKQDRLQAALAQSCHHELSLAWYTDWTQSTHIVCW